MAESELLATVREVATDVKYLRQSFDEHREAFKAHLADDKIVQQEFLRPLWEESQQQKGALHLGKYIAGTMGGIIGGLITYIAGKHG